MANAVEALASTARPRMKKSGSAGWNGSSKRDGARELSDNEKGWVQQTPEEHLTGTLEHRHQLQCQLYRIRAQT